MTAVQSAATRIPRKHRSTAPAHPSRAWVRRRFRVTLLICGGVLAAHAYVVGHGAPTCFGGFAHGLLTATSGKGTAVLVAFLIALFAAWCFRRVRLERLASGPGRIEVPNFTVASSLTAGADAAQLTALFRQRLATLRLQSPTPVPGSAPPGDFLEVLGNGAADVKNPLATLLSVLRAAKPSHAWEVSGVLFERAQRPRYGVTVQVSRIPDLGAPPETVFDHSWDRAIRRAADRATAHILPHTRTCRSPWASWRGYVMPSALIEYYETAVDMETQRRYDQALAAYYDALRLDPLNLPVRLQLGQLQEKLGLYLDALSTYQGILGVNRTGEDRDDENRHAVTERKQVLLAAKYRRIVLLGGPALAHQWFREDNADNPERNAQRRRLRERLQLQLHADLERCQPPCRTPVEDLLSLAESGKAVDGERMERELREVLALYAIDQLANAHAGVAELRTLRHGEDKLPVTDVGLQLTRICIDVRLKWLQRQLGLEDGVEWLWRDEDLEEITKKIDGLRARMCRWHEYYTAACAFALPLLVRVDAGRRQRLAEQAVALLEQATACADSGYFASRADWVLAEDPDLDGLRGRKEFKAFEATYLPSGNATPHRPRKLQRLEATRYADQLFVAAARRCALLWRRRGEQADRGAGAADWWRHELRLWRAVERAAANSRHWRARLELLEAADELSVANGEPPLEVGFRRYDEPAPDGTPPNPDDRVRAIVKRSLTRFTSLRGRLSPPGRRSLLIDAIENWMCELRRFETGPGAPTEEEIARACCRHALLWERLAEWMTATTDEAAALADTRFASELGLTVDALRRRAPQTPDPAWRSWARVGAAAMLGAWHPLALRASPKSSRPSR